MSATENSKGFGISRLMTGCIVESVAVAQEVQQRQRSSAIEDGDQPEIEALVELLSEETAALELLRELSAPSLQLTKINTELKLSLLMTKESTLGLGLGLIATPSVFALERRFGRSSSKAISISVEVSIRPNSIDDTQ